MARASTAGAGTFRAFLGFLVQDVGTVAVTIGQVDRALTRRFQDWRMNPDDW